MNSPDTHTIDEYLLDQLKGAELQAFEHQMLQDEAFATEVHERKEMIALVDAMGDKLMKERVRKIHLNELEKNSPRPLSYSWKWAIAASLAVAVGLCWWLWMRPVAPEKLYANYYQPYSLNFGARSTEGEQQLAEAGNFYKKGQFAQALPIFETLLSANPSDAKVRLAAGICQLEIKQYNQALAHFQVLIDANDPLYLEQATWYAAMTDLRKGDIPTSKALLEKIAANKDGYFYEKARQILSEI